MNKDTEFVMFILLRDSATWNQIHDLFQPIITIPEIISQTAKIVNYLKLDLYLGENIDWDVLSKTFSIMWDAAHFKIEGIPA